MNPFIEVVRSSLETMRNIREEYINNEGELLGNCDDYKIHDRIFAIYSRETPETLVHILYKLKLTYEYES